MKATLLVMAFTLAHTIPADLCACFSCESSSDCNVPMPSPQPAPGG